MGLGGVRSYAQLTGVRFLLGAVDPGLLPGLVYYLNFWYRVSERSLRVALILASATLAGAFGSAIAYGVGQMNEHMVSRPGDGSLLLRQRHLVRRVSWFGFFCRTIQRLHPGSMQKKRHWQGKVSLLRDLMAMGVD